MAIRPSCVFLDTNVYIIGTIDLGSYERQILKWLGFEEAKNNEVEVVVSEELFEQILRVSKRLKNKDWGGEILGRIWRNFNVCCVILDANEYAQVESQGIIPREDVGIYLTAKGGQAQCFVSSNHQLIRSLIQKTGEFECLTPEEFVNKYL
ncbi:hypothetical protein IQ249_22715 [Lusitaniella coriacea LEGE 07157]|uniref:PIN domain-containing protein n=1 Tax=Lusitaniella coriacea LEGE 07157 TaxID=945747 RepID=A0A8J7E2S9_9CYAN|nr:hypothetical protein [Lusitaniella coriacea LEGE 07157]